MKTTRKWIRAAVLVALVVATRSAVNWCSPSAEPLPVAQAPVRMGLVRRLRNAADILALQEMMPPQRRAGGAIYRQLLLGWALNISHIYEKKDRHKDAPRPPYRSRSLMVSEYAEVIALFSPDTLAGCSDLIQKMKGRNDLCLMVSLLDRCYRQRGWESVLKDHLSGPQQEWLDRRFDAGGTNQDFRTTIETLERDMSAQLARFALRKALPCVLLRRRQVRNASFPGDTAAWLLKRPIYRHHALRWLTLSGKSVPFATVRKIEKIASDTDLDFSLRAEAVRACGLLSPNRMVFLRLEAQLRRKPGIRGHSPRHYFARTLDLARLFFGFRTTPDNERANYLMEKSFKGGDLSNVRALAAAFYPREYLTGMLSKLEDHKGYLRDVATYQSGPKDAAGELARRGGIGEALTRRLKKDLRALPTRRLRPIVEMMAGTGDFECFGLALIRCYAAHMGPEAQESITGGIAFNLIEMAPEGTDIGEFLRRQKDDPRFKRHGSTIEAIIRRIETIRERLGWDDE
jgi:hypothetical protein